jgi:asparaginyl-tRNA synthetase
MTEFLIKDAEKFAGKEVTVKGWVYNKRSGGALVFLQIRDGTGFIQCTVVKNDVEVKVFTQAKDLMLESSVEITGFLKKEPRAPSGFEISVKDLKILQAVKEEYPIGKKDHGPDFLLMNRHLWLRSKRQWAIQRIRNTIINAIYEHLNSEGFIKIDAPILTPVACEGTTTLFPVPYLPAIAKYKNEKAMAVSTTGLTEKSEMPFAYLSQSGQLYIEAAIFAHRRVFDFGPTFRAEKSKTRRHLAEFWMMDAEAAFVDHKANMEIQEKLIVKILENILKHNQPELKMLDRDTKPLEVTAKGNYKILTHEMAVKMVNKLGIDMGERDDFGAEAETTLANQFDRPFFIEKYPKEIKAFYMKEDPKDKTRVLNSDMLAPEGYGEIIGGSQREDDYNRLLVRTKEAGLPIEDFQWYLDLRKYGSVVHSGFGIGLERIITWVCKLEHLRETIPFPRMMERFRP